MRAIVNAMCPTSRVIVILIWSLPPFLRWRRGRAAGFVVASNRFLQVPMLRLWAVACLVGTAVLRCQSSRLFSISAVGCHGSA
jgi:hypothetical protein